MCNSEFLFVETRSRRIISPYLGLEIRVTHEDKDIDPIYYFGMIFHEQESGVECEENDI